MRTTTVTIALLALVAHACGGASTNEDAAQEAAEDTVVEATEEVVPDGTEEEPAGVVCDLGTVYPGVETIDPDAPVYSDTEWTQEEVELAFQEAALMDNAYYRGYLAAHRHPEVLECAFCACGCSTMSIAHRSAVDCFKDMHGFTWMYCVNIALRAESLIEEGLTMDEVRQALKDEYPPP